MESAPSQDAAFASTPSFAFRASNFSPRTFYSQKVKIKAGHRLRARGLQTLRWHKSPAVRAPHSFIPEMEIINETTRFIQIVCLFIELCIWTWPASQITLVTAAFDGNWERWFCVMFSPSLKKKTKRGVKHALVCRATRRTEVHSRLSAQGAAAAASSSISKRPQRLVNTTRCLIHHDAPPAHIRGEKEGRWEVWAGGNRTYAIKRYYSPWM